MELDQVRGEVEKVIRWSEVKAVACALRSGNRPRVGQVIDYVIEPPPSASDCFTLLRGSSVKREKPYRVAVEQWHLDAADRMIHEATMHSALQPREDTERNPTERPGKSRWY